MTAVSIHLSFFTANNCEPIMQSEEANQMNYTSNLELAQDMLSLVNLAVRGETRELGLRGRETKMLGDRVKLGQAMM